jgi:hypothetical protein
MARHAIIVSGVVENVIEWDGKAEWQPPVGSTVVQLDDDQPCGPGWIYDGIQFTEGLP